MSDKIFIVKDDIRIEYDVLFTINDEKKEIKYVVYTDNSINDDGDARVYLARYENNRIISVSDEERKALEEIVNIVQKEVCKNEG